MSEPQSNDVVARIEQSLAALEPELLEIYDESGEHVGHAGHRMPCDHVPQSGVVGDDFLVPAQRVPAVGQLAVEVGLRVVRDGLAVPQEPELLGHTARQRSDAAEATCYRV